jgi:TorA maturation chaperone TorD
VDGHDFGQSLVDLRRFLLKTEITKIEGLDESEDSLVFLLDILATLIHDEEHDPDNARTKQSELLTKFLDPFSVHFNPALEQNVRAEFYEACAAFLSGYVDLEKGLMVDI